MRTGREGDIEGAFATLHRAVAIHQFYPGTHYLSREAMEAGYGAFVRAITHPTLRGETLSVREQTLELDGRELGVGNPAVGCMVRLLVDHGVEGLRLDGFLPPEGYAHLVALLATAPDVLRRRGGLPAAWEASGFFSSLAVVAAPSVLPPRSPASPPPEDAQDWSAPLHPAVPEALGDPRLLDRLRAFQTQGPLEREMLDLLFRAGESGDARSLSVVLDRIADIVSTYISRQQYRSAFQTLAFLHREALNHSALGSEEHAERLWASIRTMLRGPFLHWLTVEVAATRDEGDAEIGEALLRFLGEDAVVFAINTLAAERSRLGRRRLVSVLVSIGPPALPYALRMLGDQRWFVVRNMIAVIAGIGDPSTLEALGAFRQDPDPRVRREAVRALGRFRGQGAEERLMLFLRDPDAGVRGQAVSSLAAQGTPTAFEALWHEYGRLGLGGGELEDRLAILDGMGRFRLPEAVAFLGREIGKRSWFRPERRRQLQEAAIGALGEIGGEAALTRLRPLADHSDPHLRRAARRALAAAGEPVAP